ncbi:MAG: PilZ domain-containing protein [Thermoanaerobaculia bacterium]
MTGAAYVEITGASDMTIDNRKEARYFVVTPLAAEIGGVNADVIDISTRGARLQLTQQIEVGRPLSFTLHAGEVAIATSAVAVWCEVAALAMHDDESDRYFCGVTFEKSLSIMRHLIQDLITTHIAIPIEDNRNSQRYRVIAPLTASFSEHRALRVLDISIRGARIGTPEPLKAGTSSRICFAINGDDTLVWLPATVMWSRPAERKGRYETGLRISDAEDWLRTMIDELSLRNGVVIETDSLRRKFDPFSMRPLSGLVGLRR